MSIKPNSIDDKLIVNTNDTSANSDNSNNIDNIDNSDKYSENTDFLDKLEEYYKLKNNYETQLQEKKNAILNNDSLNKREKQEKYSKLKIKCINCNKKEGTIFENNQGTLSAICGDKTNPCNLNIKIFRGKFVNIESVINMFQEDVDETKENIIKVKLNLLFGYENENTTVKKFNTLKQELMQDLESVMADKTLFIEKTTNLDNKIEIHKETNKLFEEIELIKSTVQEFNEIDNIQIIKDMVVRYTNNLLPLLIKLRELKYKYMAMEYNRDFKIYKLKKKIYTIQDMLSCYENPVVEYFEKGIDKRKQIKENLKNDDDWDDEDRLMYD
tara:strand:+ start:62 stop:1045 length:984 start_codon:yes stop_codon:yes gene_type:complete